MNTIENMERKIAEKFFNNRSTREETEWILEWFDTPEGRKYLEEKLDTDFDLMDEDDIQSLIFELDSDRMFKSIQEKIQIRRIGSARSRNNFFGIVLKVAATFLVILAASLFVSRTYDPVPEQVTVEEPVHFQTSEDQQREITLGDGTVIRLNHSSAISIADDFMGGSREVTLTGEAYFDVEHNPEKPFVIHANQSKIQVLGTAFNVKSVSEKNEVQVAVVEGRVSFASTTSNLEEHSVVLKRGQFGYLDLNERTISVDDYAVENYLSWRSGRLVFENLTLAQVCTQLSRLYEIECGYESEALKDLRLTANFSNDSLEKTLSVISLSLKIDFENKDNEVYWKN